MSNEKCIEIYGNESLAPFTLSTPPESMVDVGDEMGVKIRGIGSVGEC